MVFGCLHMFQMLRAQTEPSKASSFPRQHLAARRFGNPHLAGQATDPLSIGRSRHVHPRAHSRELVGRNAVALRYGRHRAVPEARTWLLCCTHPCSRPSGTIQFEGTLETAGLGDHLRQLPHCRVILETAAESFRIADQARSAGHEVRVVPATLVRTLGVGARSTKTDKRDARARARSVDAGRSSLGAHTIRPLARVEDDGRRS